MKMPLEDLVLPGEFDPSLKIENMVVLVTDKNHPRFRQIGKLTAHDWSEYGVYFVQFLDGKTEEFQDGLCEGDKPSKVRAYYRKSDTMGVELDQIERQGPETLRRKYLELGGDLVELNKVYTKLFGERLT